MKICIITGGSQGLGLDMAQRFLALEHKVIVLDVLPCPLKDVDFMDTDISNPQAIAKTFSHIQEKYHTAHILINNGAVSAFEKPVGETSLEDIDKVLHTNLRGAYLCAQAFLSLNAGQDYGRIINIASTRWHQNMAHWELYGMSKGGLVSMSNTLCVSLIGTPVTVNTISPGHIHTGDAASLDAYDHAIHPSNRVGMPRDVTNICVFLAHEENDFINGAHIIVDGGMTKKMIY